MYGLGQVYEEGLHVVQKEDWEDAGVTLNQALGTLAVCDSSTDGASFVSVETAIEGSQVAGYRTRVYTVYPTPDGSLSTLDSVGWCSIDDNHGLVKHLINGLTSHLILYEQLLDPSGSSNNLPER